jgi:hypothetical protein
MAILPPSSRLKQNVLYRETLYLQKRHSVRMRLGCPFPLPAPILPLSDRRLPQLAERRIE